jgi:trk system potassium uptake protein TrkA
LSPDGGRVGLQTGENLAEQCHEVVSLEVDEIRAEELSEEFRERKRRR